MAKKQEGTQKKTASTKTKAPAAGSAKAEKPQKRIAIVGCSDSKDAAPYGDTSWEIWAMNNAYAHVTRRNIWFEIHPIKLEKGKYYRRKLIRPGVFKYMTEFRGAPMESYMEELAALDIPVYMQKHWDIIPKSIAYPLEKVIKTFGKYFTNSVSYMIALAILEKPTEIGAYGVDMATGSEYGPQRPSCEFFLGVAAGMGIKITIPKSADLLKTKFLYGFQEREQTIWEEKMTAINLSLHARHNKAVQQAKHAEKQTQQYIGAQETLAEIERIWSNLMTTTQWSDPQ